MCTISSDNCTLCEDSNNRTKDASCDCLRGFWDDGNETCEICPKNCIECADDTNCSECVISATITRELPLCTCPDGYYDNNTDDC